MDAHLVTGIRPGGLDGESWDRMTADEVMDVARTALTAARCLRRLLAHGIFTAIAGRRVAHVHQHVFARLAGTPGDIDWFRSASWTGVRRVPAVELEAFARRLGLMAEEL